MLGSSVTPLGGGFSRLTIDLRNDGFLPTNGTTQALTTASVRKAPKAELVLSDGLELVSGKARPQLPHLSGRTRHAFAAPHPSGSSGPNTEEARLEWIVKGSGEATLCVVRHEGATYQPPTRSGCCFIGYSPGYGLVAGPVDENRE